MIICKTRHIYVHSFDAMTS